MKTMVAFGLIFIGLLHTGCQKKESPDQTENPTQNGCWKGILVKKGICGQRVIKIISSDKNGLAFATTWKDETSGKTYENVFTVENFCTFPSSVNEGDEVSFSVTANRSNNCIVCQAYTPVPNEKNSITTNANCTGEK